MKRRRRQSLKSGLLLFLISAVVCLLFLHFNVAQKWEAPAFWTSVCFASIISLSRRRWQEADFWVRLSVIFAIHGCGMMFLFGYVITGRNFPWIVTIPFAWGEVMVILKLVHVQERRPARD